MRVGMQPQHLRIVSGVGVREKKHRGQRTAEGEGFGGRLEAGTGGETDSESHRVAERGLAAARFDV